MKYFALLVAVVMVCGLAVVGCKTGHKGTMHQRMAMEQMTCPMTGNPINKEFHSDYMGRTIYFCSQACKAAFDNMSDADKAAIVKKMDDQMMKMQQGTPMKPQGGSM